MAIDRDPAGRLTLSAVAARTGRTCARAGEGEIDRDRARSGFAVLVLLRTGGGIDPAIGTRGLFLRSPPVFSSGARRG